MKSGKRLEQQVKKSAIEKGILYERFQDKASGFDSGQKTRFTLSNPSDCFLFNGSKLVYVEMKSHKGVSLPLGCIRDNQVKQMTERAIYKNVICGFLISFDEEEKCYFMTIQEYNEFIRKSDRKSIPIEYLNAHCVEIPMKKKKVNYTYDIIYIFKERE